MTPLTIIWNGNQLKRPSEVTKWIFNLVENVSLFACETTRWTTQEWFFVPMKSWKWCNVLLDKNPIWVCFEWYSEEYWEQRQPNSTIFRRSMIIYRILVRFRNPTSCDENYQKHLICLQDDYAPPNESRIVN